MLLFIENILSFFKKPSASLIERVKDEPLYKIFVSGFPELLISVYVISMIGSSLWGPEKSGIRGLISFFEWVHLGFLGNPISGFLAWIDGQGKDFVKLLFIVPVFMLLSSLSYYLRDSLDRILSLNGRKISLVPNSSYIFIFSIFLIIDYGNIFRSETIKNKISDHEVDCIFNWIAVIIFAWIFLFFCFTFSKILEAKVKWGEINKDWFDNIRFWVFAISNIVLPLIFSTFSSMFLLLLLLFGFIASHSGGAVLFNGTEDSRKKKREKIKNSLDELKEKIYQPYRGGSRYHSKVRGAIQSVGRDAEIVPVLPDENFADVIRRNLMLKHKRPLIIVTEVDGEIYTYIIRNYNV
mgnify:CR=1 FL=1